MSEINEATKVTVSVRARLIPSQPELEVRCGEEPAEKPTSFPECVLCVCLTVFIHKPSDYCSFIRLQLSCASPFCGPICNRFAGSCSPETEGLVVKCREPLEAQRCKQNTN